jgi:hypothetical protein
MPPGNHICRVGDATHLYYSHCKPKSYPIKCMISPVITLDVNSLLITVANCCNLCEDLSFGFGWTETYFGLHTNTASDNAAEARPHMCTT